MARDVGRLTLAASLIILGVAFMVDNLMGWRIAWWLARLWPLLLIGFGLEWVWAAQRGDSGQRLRPDSGAVAMLVLLGIASAIWAENSMPRVVVAPPSIRYESRNSEYEHRYTMPQIVIPNPVAIPFGNASANLVQTFDQAVPDLKMVDVADSSAAIEVTRGGRFQVELSITGYGLTEQDARLNAERVRLRVDQGQTTRIRAEGAEGLSRYTVRYRIQLPDGVGLKAESTSGSIRVSDLRGAVILQSSSGSIRVEKIAGDVTAIATSGSIDAQEVHGLIRATASSGAIRVEEPRGPLSLQTTSGAIRVTADEVVGDMDLTTSSGSVTVTIPEEAGVAVNARTSSGTVTGPAWLTIGEGRGSGSGTQGDGKHYIQIRTSSGPVQLRVD